MRRNPVDGALLELEVGVEVDMRSPPTGQSGISRGDAIEPRDGPVGEDEGVDSFNDFLAIVTRCLPDGADTFFQAAYLWAGLHGRVALSDAIPTFPWPPENEYIERMIEIHVTAHTDLTPR
jgi:hypothetical protein